MATVLIVEDHVPSRSAMKIVLEQNGYRVQEAADGVEALAKLRLESPDLIVSDMLLPRMDGYELIRQVRSDAALESIRVVLYTATYSSAEAHALAEACGVDAIIGKPADPKEVLKTVAEVLERPRPTRSAIGQAAFDREHARVLVDKLVEESIKREAAEQRLAEFSQSGRLDGAIRPILLVEDNRMDVELTLDAFRLAHLANKVHVAPNGESALDYLFGHGKYADRETYPLPSFILLDLKMAGIDGFEVLRHIKETPRLKRLPVIILTSSRDEGDRAMSYDCGANSYLVKPVSFEGFLDVIRQVKDYWSTLNVGPPESDRN